MDNRTATSNSLFYYDSGCERHTMGAGHPEQPARMPVVLDAVKKALPQIVVRSSLEATHRTLCRAHTTAHVDTLFALGRSDKMVALDADTSMNRHSLHAACQAVGAIVDATTRIGQKQAGNAFCCVRPPGHHAVRAGAMGFCLFNGIAVAALHALDELGMERVAIVDFDVHHGNGSEDIFRDDARVLLCSAYQHPFYPGVSSSNIVNRLLNVPLPAGTDGATYQAAVGPAFASALRAFSPQIILVSAGFDGHRDDPLGDFNLLDDDYVWLARILLDLADELCDGRLVAVLEGGYDLAALGRCAARFVTELHNA